MTHFCCPLDCTLPKRVIERQHSMLLSSFRWHSCQLISVVKLELLESESDTVHRPLLHRCCSVVVHNSLMIWLAGQARQRHGAIITDGEAVCAKQTQVDTEIYVEPSCAIHLNRGNILRVVLTSFNHGGNWCIFFCSYKQARGKELLSVCFFPSSLLLFPLTTCHMLLWQTIDCTDEGKKATRGKVRETRRCDEKGKAQGETERQRNTGTVRRLKPQKLRVEVEEEEEWRNK